MDDEEMDDEEMNDDYDDMLLAFENLMNLLERGATFEDAVARLRRLFGGDMVDRAVSHYRGLVARAADPGDMTAIKGVGAAEAWYPGPREVDSYWPSLRKHLLEHPKRPWSREEVDELDRQSGSVLASCQSPWKEKSDGRGLVVGYVQSGKTTNFTAVMAKAADTGFRFFIVLSGTTRSLRRQTQKRLEEQLEGTNPLRWYFHTELDQDMGKSARWVPFLSDRKWCTVVVVKKNTKRLQNLIKSLDRAEELGILDNCPIMVIDDEGDQASLSPDCDRKHATKINKLIVEILRRPRLSYVAYTATPFANFFVDPHYPDNLYPRDFIMCLPESKGYFGSRKLFGPDGEPEVLSVIDVPDAEVDDYLPVPETAPASLRDAVQWFLMAATARRLRNGGLQPHTTMLVNVSERISVHEDYWQLVRAVVVELAAGIRANDATVRSAMSTQWDGETMLVDPADFGHAPVHFDVIWSELPRTIDLLGPLNGKNHDSDEDCGIVVDNSASAVRLAYDDDEPRPVIVVGGNTLSRGLTLEGLVSTFFLRSTKLYDSLLQMGRWFGFRAGYEDLPRVWMPKDTRERFEFLAKVELDLRQWIDVYARTGKTPLELGPRIMMHPSMLITKAAMMRRFSVENLDLSAGHAETSIFENTAAVTSRNQQLATELAEALLATGLGNRLENGHLFRGVDVSLVERFFRSGQGYEIVGHSHMTSELLLKYVALKKKHGELERWNVVFRKKTGGKTVEFLPGIDSTLVERSRKTVNGVNLDIGSLADSGDRRLDVPSTWSGSADGYRRDHPLLVIYVIDKDSRPNKAGVERGNTDLAAVDHLVGVNIFLPVTRYFDDEQIAMAKPKGPWDSVVEEADDEGDPEADDEGDADGDGPESVTGDSDGV
jgi:hypothetical protein